MSRAAHDHPGDGIGADVSDGDEGARRARAKRMTIVLALVAASFYLGFIAMQVMGAR